MATLDQKREALRKIGSTLTIEDNEHMDHELQYIKDSDPQAHHDYLRILDAITKRG